MLYSVGRRGRWAVTAMQMEIRGQASGLSPLCSAMWLPRRHVALPTEPSHWPSYLTLKKKKNLLRQC